MAIRNQLVVGMVCGALIGSAAGVLLAPNSGKATRETLVGRFKNRAGKNGDLRRLNPVGTRQS